jgi:hypothetical protein
MAHFVIGQMFAMLLLRFAISDISILPSADLAPRRYGVCVQCLDDCDCDVNQYCGTDPYDPIKIPPFVSESLSNVTIQSKCMDYFRPLSRCYSDSTVYGLFQAIVEVLLG